MDLAAGSRVRVAKYGKNKSRTQPHNFYDAPVDKTVPPASRLLPISPTSVGNERQSKYLENVPVLLQSPSRIRSTRPAHVTSHLGSSVSASHDSRSVFPRKDENVHPLDVRKSTLDIMTSAFDIPTSDDDSDLTKRRPVKKLRLSPAPRDKKVEVPMKPVPLKEANDDEHSTGRPKLKDANQPPLHEKAKPRRLAKKRSSQDMMDIERALETHTATTITQTESRPLKVARRGPLNASLTSKSQSDQISKSQSTPLKSRSKLKARTLGSKTPQKLKQHGDLSDTSCASPSQLDMDNLRLTRETSPELEHTETAAPSPTIDLTQALPRGKTRRIDKLDAGISQSDSRPEKAAKKFATRLENLQKGVDIGKPVLPTEGPKLVRLGSAETRQTYGRPRNTYAKERSHLSDMLDDLDTTSNDGSQGPNQQLLSGLMIGGPSQLQSQLELESDSSDGMPTQRLKSVHELRQAGANNRLEKEVEDLMVDVNPTNGSKALRITALIQVIRKMSQERFAAFLLDHALERLTEWSPLMKDKISKLLLGMIFWRMVHSSTISPLRLRQIVQCVASNSSSLPPLDTIAQIAKTRSENFSKSTIRDLVEFEHSIIRDDLLPAYEGEHVIPAAITLGVLNDSLRAMIGAGSLTPLPRSSYPQIIALLQQVSQQSGEQPVKHVFVTKLALSLLRICVGPLQQELGLSQSEYVGLGETIASIMERSVNIHEDLLQAVLHFAITLSNDKPEICNILCHSSFTHPLMMLIESRFLGFMEAAKDSQGAEEGRLDSIILTLACLLNITEHDNSVRRAFATSRLHNGGATHLSRLVSIYMAAPKLEGARTTEQTSGLISIGYLSLLICNLCSDEQLWQDVSNQLRGQYAISDVVASAKELLIHLRTLDTTEDNIASEPPDDGITVRFGEILNAVRLE